MNILIIAIREMKLGFRNPWAYSFLALFSLFSLGLLLIQSQSSLQGYTHTTGTMLNLILYLLPLMTLLLGSFAITAEKEEGGWALLSTYALSTFAFLLGKYVGLFIVLTVIVAFGFGLSGVLGAVLGEGFSGESLLFFFGFSLLLVFLFLSIAVWIGTASRNRWQALTVGVSVWFVYIIGWSNLLIAVLGGIKYSLIKPVLVTLTFLNPAELVRIFMVAKMGGGSIFGPEYYKWIEWIQGSWGTPVFIAVCLLWVTVALGTAILVWERGRRRG